MLRMCKSVGFSEYFFKLILPFWIAAGVQATHFRGGIIMVRPVDGGAPAEVRNLLTE